MSDPVEHDLEVTTSALKAGPTDLGITGGLREIRRWQDRLDATDAPALEEIGAVLAELRGDLGGDMPDEAVVADLLWRLASRASRSPRTSRPATNAPDSASSAISWCRAPLRCSRWSPLRSLLGGYPSSVARQRRHPQGAPTEGTGAGEVAAGGGVAPGGVVVGVARAEGGAVREPTGGGVWKRGAGVDGGAGLVGAVAVGAVVGVGVGVVVTAGVLVGAVGVVEGRGGELDLIVRLGMTISKPLLRAQVLRSVTGVIASADTRTTMPAHRAPLCPGIVASPRARPPRSRQPTRVIVATGNCPSVAGSVKAAVNTLSAVAPTAQRSCAGVDVPTPRPEEPSRA